MNAIAISLVFLGTASSALASDWVIGTGMSDYTKASTETFFALEIYGKPFSQQGRLSFGTVAGLTVDGAGDVWAGVGIAGLYNLDQWFIEASIMPGYYHASEPAADLGSGLEFRSLIGLGYAVNQTTRVSIAIDHKSNAGFGKKNPGVNSISLRLRKAF